jgi:uncharacterized protein (TIGR00369 family)
VTWPFTFDASDGARYSPATIGVMIDESFGRVANAIRPPGRAIVTSEISIDLVETAGGGDRSLCCHADAVTATPDAALVHSRLQDEHHAVVATASTWCRFIADDHDENHPYPQAAKPPPDLALHRLLTTSLSPDEHTVTARFTPDDQCTNDLGTLHGGIALAAALDVGLTWLQMIYGEAAASSIRINLLRPSALNQLLEIDAMPVHTGRNVSVTRITSRNPAGKATTVATVTGVPVTPNSAKDSPAHRSARRVR